MPANRTQRPADRTPQRGAAPRANRFIAARQSRLAHRVPLAETGRVAMIAPLTAGICARGDSASRIQRLQFGTAKRPSMAAQRGCRAGLRGGLVHAAQRDHRQSGARRQQAETHRAPATLPPGWERVGNTGREHDAHRRGAARRIRAGVGRDEAQPGAGGQQGGGRSIGAGPPQPAPAASAPNRTTRWPRARAIRASARSARRSPSPGGSGGRSRPLPRGRCAHDAVPAPHRCVHRTQPDSGQGLAGRAHRPL
jgi:hypothetical protein